MKSSLDYYHDSGRDMEQTSCSARQSNTYLEKEIQLLMLLLVR